MYQSSRHETPDAVQIKIPWDRNTALGFASAVLILILTLLIAPFFKMSPPPKYNTVETVPLTLLIFGSGDGTGLKSGNLTEEGAKAKGEAPKINIQDAEQAASNVKKSTITSPTEMANKLTAVKELTSDTKNDNAKKGSDLSSVGAEDGDLNGTGLKTKGTGRGAGDGFGDIDWGGGGNRIVTNKIMPRFPNSAKSSAQIRLRFKVLPDGTVTGIVPLQKADPALELAAIEALKRWRFNPISEDKGIMVGTIPLTFILK